MFWLSRWQYSGVPGVGPAAQTPSAPKPAVRIPAIANATVTLIRLPMVFLPQLVVPLLPRRPRTTPAQRARAECFQTARAKSRHNRAVSRYSPRPGHLVLARPPETSLRCRNRGRAGVRGPRAVGRAGRRRGLDEGLQRP